MDHSENEVGTQSFTKKQHLIGTRNRKEQEKQPKGKNHNIPLKKGKKNMKNEEPRDYIYLSIV